jgi:hypothetical protein
MGGFPGSDALGREALAAQQAPHPFVRDRGEKPPGPTVLRELGHGPDGIGQPPLQRARQRHLDHRAQLLGPAYRGPPLGIGGLLEGAESVALKRRTQAYAIVQWQPMRSAAARGDWPRRTSSITRYR